MTVGDEYLLTNCILHKKLFKKLSDGENMYPDVHTDVFL